MKQELAKVMFFTLVLLMSSCTQENIKKFIENTVKEEIPFKIVNIDKSEFRESYESYRYKFKGEVQNVSKNTFDNVYTSVGIEFVLENGNIITEEDYSTLGAFRTSTDLKELWKSEEIHLITGSEKGIFSLFGDGKGIESNSIPTHYKEYPIKKVNAIIRYRTTDLINKKEEIYYYSLDVTKEWKTINGKREENPENIENKSLNFRDNKTFEISRESRSAEAALVNDIFEKDNKKYLSLDIVQIKFTGNGNDYDVINENPKIRICEVSDKLEILDKNCNNFYNSDYLIRNKNKIISKDAYDICVFSSENGVVTYINLGCWN